MLTQRALIGNLSNSLVNEAELELDLSELEKTYNKIMETGMTENDVIELSPKQIIKDLDERLDVTRNENIRKSRTTKLLLLHVRYTSIVKCYSLRENVLLGIASPYGPKNYESLCCFWTYQLC